MIIETMQHYPELLYSDSKNTNSYAYAITREVKKKIMNKYTAYCGLNCKTCEARLATVNNDNELRKKVAAEWSKLNQEEILPEMINCEGCCMDGVKTPFCESLCEIRKCAIKNNMETCMSCSEMSSCTKIKMISDNNDVFSH